MQSETVRISSLPGTQLSMPKFGIGSLAFAACLGLLHAPAAHAQSEPAAPEALPSGNDDPQAQEGAEQLPEDSSDTTSSGPTTDIFSRQTIHILVDGRLVIANGEQSWVNRGFGKTRFQGTSDGDYRIRPRPIEATLMWTPRFTSSVSGNVSVGWQRDQENDVDLIEAFLQFLPQQTGNVGFSARAGLMWPEISLEHSTGGAWSVVNTITPSTINSWIGEEVKILGLEGTLHVRASEHEFNATAGIFGFNDTSGTLLSFRGWALHDLKATAFGHFPLPPLNDFMVHAQEDRTRSLIELDDRPGFYGRLEWRPPWPFGAALFYYDNRGDPEAFNSSLQWGWRTRFWNLGVNADIAPNTRLLAQGMTGSTIMGFRTNGVRWVHTHFRSAYLLLSHQLDDKWGITGRIEAFDTRERGSEMSRDESEEGWSWTAAARYTINDNLTAFVEALNVRSRRGVRTRIGLPPFQAQTIFQASLRFKL